MTPLNDDALHDLLVKLFQVHPWHGVAPGADAPEPSMPTSRSSRPTR